MKVPLVTDKMIAGKKAKLLKNSPLVFLYLRCAVVMVTLAAERESARRDLWHSGCVYMHT